MAWFKLFSKRATSADGNKIPYTQSLKGKDIGAIRYLAWSQSVAFTVSNLVTLVAACVVNVFSSFQYNGVLITFVLLLALISHSEPAEEPAL